MRIPIRNSPCIAQSEVISVPNATATIGGKPMVPAKTRNRSHKPEFNALKSAGNLFSRDSAINTQDDAGIARIAAIPSRNMQASRTDGQNSLPPWACMAYSNGAAPVVASQWRWGARPTKPTRGETQGAHDLK